MQDLQTIARNNAAVVQRAIPDLVAAGHYVVAEYAGLHFVGIHTFRGDNPDGTARERAQAQLAELNASITGTHGILHEPISDYVGHVREIDDASPSSSEPLAA